MTQRHITRAKVHVDRSTSPHPNHYRAAKDAKSRMARLYHDENVARCHRCPHGSFCSTCGPLNRARIELGLIRPKHQGDHANNILYPTPLNKKAKISTPPARRFGRACSRLIGMQIKPLGGGWWQPTTTIDKFEINVGPKLRTRAAALAWAQADMATISENLAMGIDYDV